MHAGVEPHHRSRADIVWSVRACEGIVRVPLFSSKLQITQLKRIQKQEKKGEDKLEGRIRERKKVAHVA